MTSIHVVSSTVKIFFFLFPIESHENENNATKIEKEQKNEITNYQLYYFIDKRFVHNLLSLILFLSIPSIHTSWFFMVFIHKNKERKKQICILSNNSSHNSFVAVCSSTCLLHFINKIISFQYLSMHRYFIS